jgi:hypothetical protein
MRKPSVTQYLSEREKRGAIEAALKGGLEPKEVFEAILKNVYGVAKRKRLIIEWGKKMGLNANDSLRIAQGANLIPTKRKPPLKAEKKPPHKGPEKTSE